MRTAWSPNVDPQCRLLPDNQHVSGQNLQVGTDLDVAHTPMDVIREDALLLLKLKYS